MGFAAVSPLYVFIYGTLYPYPCVPSFSGWTKLFSPSVGRLIFLYAYRPRALNDENVNAVIAPGPEPSNRGTPVDINAFHAAHAHAHQGALRKTAKQMGVTLKGELHECKDCSMVMGIRIPIFSKTHGRAAKRLFRVIVDLGGEKHIASMGGNKYPMIVRDDFSRQVWMYFVSHKYDAASAFEKFLADLRVENTPSEVAIVRSDNVRKIIYGRKIRKTLSRAKSKIRIHNCKQPGVQWGSRAGVGHDRVRSTGRENPSVIIVPRLQYSRGTIVMGRGDTLSLRFVQLNCDSSEFRQSLSA